LLALPIPFFSNNRITWTDSSLHTNSTNKHPPTLETAYIKRLFATSVPPHPTVFQEIQMFPEMGLDPWEEPSNPAALPGTRRL